MNGICEASILTWVPEFENDRVVLLRVFTADPLVERALMEDGPVSHREPGFTWSQEPVGAGLCVWRGRVEAEENGNFHFDGEWSLPTAIALLAVRQARIL